MLTAIQTITFEKLILNKHRLLMVIAECDFILFLIALVDDQLNNFNSVGK